MAENTAFTCPQCGKEIKDPGSFCPHCGAALPRDQEQDSSGVGYWNFYGVFDPEEEIDEPKGMGARGTLRFLAVVCLAAALILGFALTSWKWGFKWEKAWPVWAVGGGVGLVLVGLSFLVKKRE